MSKMNLMNKTRMKLRHNQIHLQRIHNRLKQQLLLKIHP